MECVVSLGEFPKKRNLLNLCLNILNTLEDQILPNLLGAAARYWPSLLSSAWEYCDGVELELLAADGLGLGFLFLTWNCILY